jgi:G:T-mismatch repair DNA endonuclease (very short patch repair protein)
MRCIFCNKEFNSSNHLKIHINRHHNIDELTNEVNYLKSCGIINDSVFDDVKNMYLSGYTINDLKEKHGISFSRYIELIGIKRTNSESKKTKIYEDRFKKTNLDRYGVENPSQDFSVKQKKKNTFLKNFGYENNFCNIQIHKLALSNIDYTKVADTTKKNLAIKYGENITNVAQLDNVRLKISNTNKLKISKLSEDERRKMTEIARSNVKYVSSQEVRIQSILNLLNITYTANGFLFSYNFDFIFKNKKIIEVQGDFWHANPNKYKENDILLDGLSVKDVWDKDKRKKKLLELKGYEVYYLWENEINNMTDEELIKKLKEILC